MASILVLTPAPSEQVVPALELLSHQVRLLTAEPARLISAPDSEIVMIDARKDLAAAKTLCALLRAAGRTSGIVLIVTEGGMAAVSAEWGIDDVMLADAGPAEVDARIRLALARAAALASPTHVHASGISIDEQSYSAKLRGKPLDLTYKEFQLLHFLAANPARVFTREQLLSEVWGYDYFGGARTVDVHVRRLRAKLGDQEQIIGTVRNVGYRFNVYDEEQTGTVNA